MDEAAARLRMAVESKPEELDEIDRRLMQIRIEAEALKKEKDDASKDRLKRREVEIKELQAKSDEISAAWKAEKGRLAGATNAKERLDKARAETGRRRTPLGLGARGRDQVWRDPGAREADRGIRRQGRHRQGRRRRRW